MKFPAPAKINLYLKVTATLPDGYHELDTGFAYVDVADELTISPADNLSVTCSNPHLNGEKNLVYRVLDAFRKQHGLSSGLSVHIDKQLPDRAGLGGGSSDAATALMVANRLWGVELSRQELIRFATPFGADIPCFLFARASLAAGIGEQLSDYPGTLPAGFILLAYPGIGLSTPEVFSCYDRQTSAAAALTHNDATDTIRAHSGAAPGETAIGDNDLEACACTLSTEVDELLKELRRASDMAWMSGSGSVSVALFEHRQEAEDTASMLLEGKLATWIHVGNLLSRHPLQDMNIGA
ncbi:MAG: 4-(cytidine 5'-diphospho)-2-C-methyl-D-erythritol kinase [Mariprofundaceae bacterium]|nr:4-(cytidine 5'-diphospho)-2-C-methyl-D-erythritol kinase [Mariprofundaceae bacterium]